MAKKVIVSKLNYDAITETNPDNLIFSSDYNTLKYYKSGNISISLTLTDGNIAQTSVTVAHDLGYKPLFIAYEYNSTTGKVAWLPYRTEEYHIIPPRSYDYNRTYLNCYSDETNLTIKLWGVRPTDSVPHTYTYVVYYKIFKNNLNL